jgi:hypothetical protein
MKSLLLAFFVLLSCTAYAQKPYSISKDEETGGLVFKGPITLADLNGEPSFKWMKKGMDSYEPDANAVTYLAKALPPYTLIVLMGTWCDDSQNLIPKLAKVLQAAKFPTQHMAMWGVDRAKQTGGVENRTFELKKVPTIIVFKGNREVGRIVESVSRSVEVDLAQILQKEEQ